MVAGIFTDYHAKFYAYALTRQASGENVERLSTSLFDASLDLNPHQIEAALFTLRSPLSNGVVLADEAVPSNPDLEQILTTIQQEITKRVNSRNLTFFEEEVNKLDHWADDLKFDLEQAIKEIRRNAKIAPTLEEKLSWQKKQRDLERARNKQRKELFDRQDKVDERREALIEQLESKLNQKIQIEDLFTIRWSLQLLHVNSN